MLKIICRSIVLLLTASSSIIAAEIEIDGHVFQLPDGFIIEKVAGPPLVNRPISASFDQQGRLYVADSSGSNEPVKEQLENPTHRIVRLEDSNGDGLFDKSVVFAENVMFPEGTVFFDGSLYVSAAPSIWKFTDTDGDGKADLREEWFQGKTLTHCANDLHGPYLGPDGWFYWCKGAYAEQTYDRIGNAPFVTQAAHVFRCRPDAPRDPKTGSVLTSAIEPVMTGGMANPVDVTFTSTGERIFTTTFLIRPQAGLRDGLIHAVYGGVYGQKNDSRLEGHPRTGELMPVLFHMGAAAPCGLTRYESNQFGNQYRDNLFACLFNMRKITRHVIEPDGATFKTTSEDFLVSNNLDFHPTDVLEDADGSLIVIDTGGWYKLCCPTSQLEKPDILGAIYRVRKIDAPVIDDPRGLKLAWSELSPGKLIPLLGDARHEVRIRAIEELSSDRVNAISSLHSALTSNQNVLIRRNAIWALTRIDHEKARAAVRIGLQDRDETVRQAAIHSASVWRDQKAVSLLVEILKNKSIANHRAVAEALGRIGNAKVVPALLDAAGRSTDRVLEHSLTYALIELADVRQTRLAISSHNARSKRAALIALDQMNDGNLQTEDVVPLLSADNPLLKQTANWIVNHHSEWGESLVPYFKSRIAKSDSFTDSQRNELSALLARFAATKQVQQLLAASLADTELSDQSKQLVLQTMAQSSLKQLPSSWIAPLTDLLDLGHPKRTLKTVSVLRSVRIPKDGAGALIEKLLAIARQNDASDDLRLQSLFAVRGHISNLDDDLFKFVAQNVNGDLPVSTRVTVVEILATIRLNASQLNSLSAEMKTVSPLDINRLLSAFSRSKEEQVGLTLISALSQSSARSALHVETLKKHLSKYPSKSVQKQAGLFYDLLEEENSEQKEKLEQALASLPDGDVRRGQEVFHSEKTACSSCHAIGYLGGRVGPDLTRIARIRNSRDLLEAILFPSVSLVQNYESVTVLTVDGLVFNGLVQRETKDELVLVLSSSKEVRIARDDIEEMKQSSVSVMPAGLDKQLTPQQLADLVEFLKSRK